MDVFLEEESEHSVDSILTVPSAVLGSVHLGKSPESLFPVDARNGWPFDFFPK